MSNLNKKLTDMESGAYPDSPKHQPKNRERTQFDVEVGWRLRVIRQKHKMSMHELGAKIGLSYGQINKYERGFNRISIERLRMFSEIFGVPAGYFLGETEKNYPPYYMNRVMTIAAEIENTPNEEIRNTMFRLVRLANKALASERDKNT